jgi:hypothetical protein
MTHMPMFPFSLIVSFEAIGADIPIYADLAQAQIEPQIELEVAAEVEIEVELKLSKHLCY